MAGNVRDLSLLPDNGSREDERVSSRRVVFVAFPQFQMLDLTGPFEVFAQAGGYLSTTVSADGGPLTAAGLSRVRQPGGRRR